MNHKVAFHTLGCKLNYSESSAIGQQFQNHGFQIVQFKDRADVYVINTCTVTDNADKECRQIIRRALRQNPEAYIIVTGCYAQLKPDEISDIEGVDAVLGSNEKFKIFSLLKNFEKKELSCIHVTPVDEIEDVFSASSSDNDERTRAFLKIQDGCDYKCSFCTIPIARGKSRSLPEEEVLSNFKSLLDHGYKEIILTGVNVGDYGKAINSSLFKLINLMITIPGDFRIRISSIEPNLLTDEIINLTADSNKLCKHFHIPLQSGSSKILRLMQRRYTKEDYEKVVINSQKKIKDLGIGIDVIVGFPGETDEDFTETYKFLSDLPFSYLHVFTYSERANTKALSLEGSVEPLVRKTRNNMLRILSDKKKKTFYQSMIGKELSVLFEKENKENEMKGFASNYVRVKSLFEENLINKLTTVKILEVDDSYCVTDFNTCNSQMKSAE